MKLFIIVTIVVATLVTPSSTDTCVTSNGVLRFWVWGDTARGGFLHREPQCIEGRFE